MRERVYGAIVKTSSSLSEEATPDQIRNDSSFDAYVCAIFCSANLLEILFHLIYRVYINGKYCKAKIVTNAATEKNISILVTILK